MIRPPFGARTTTIHIARVSAAILIVSSGLKANAEPCAAAVRLLGDPALVEPVGAGLVAQGITLDPNDECTAVSASLSTAASDLRIHIEDVNGQTVERAVATTGAAVSLIESWARPELTESLLTPAGPVSDTSDKSVNAAKDDEIPPAPATVEKKSPEPTNSEAIDDNRNRRLPPFWLQADFEFSAGADRSIWLGTRVRSCVEIGRVCVGIAARFAGDLMASGDSATYDTSRKSLDALATIDVPFARRRLFLIPGLGIGGGWAFLNRNIQDDFTLSKEDKAELHKNTFGMRVNAAFAVSSGLTDNLYLDMSILADLLLFGREEVIVRGSKEWSIAGVPIFSGRVALGFRYVF